MTPEQEEQVARALAETARHEPVPPMPADVAARLDRVLADLAAPRVVAGDRTGAREAEDDEPAPAARAVPDELAARRGRRWPQVLVAAAAVSVIGLAGAAVATRGFGGLSPSPSSTDSAAGGSSSSREQPPPGADDAGPAPSASAGGRALTAAGPLPRLGTATLAEDVRRLVETGPASPQRGTLLQGEGGSAARDCAAPSVRAGQRLVAVRLDGRPATLRLGAPHAGTLRAQVFSCLDATVPVAGTVVRSR